MTYVQGASLIVGSVAIITVLLFIWLNGDW